MFEDDRICLPLCPDGFFRDTLTMSCVETCPDNYYGKRGSNLCVLDCNPLFRDDFSKECETACNLNRTASTISYMCQDQCDYGEYSY